MQNDYYVLAHEQAAKERTDLRAQIKKLLARDAKLEKLVDCLKEFLPEAEAAAPVSEHQPDAAEQPEPQAQEHEHAVA